VKASKHLASLVTTDWQCEWQSLDYLYLMFSCCQLPFCEFPKHNRTSLQVWHANVLQFCPFYKPTFSRATREWDALYKCDRDAIWTSTCRQYYSYVTDTQCKRVGTQCWVYGAIMVTEALLCIKNGKQLFERTQAINIIIWLLLQLLLSVLCVYGCVLWHKYFQVCWIILSQYLVLQCGLAQYIRNILVGRAIDVRYPSHINNCSCWSGTALYWRHCI
jgi:hypothetical protein